MASNGQLAHQPSSPTSHYGNLPHWTSNVSRGIKRLFPPVNGKSLLRHYVPLGGSLSHSLFTMHIFAPSIFARVFSVYDLAASNIILFNAHLGLGFYIYFRPHMHRLWRWRRVEFSVLATVMFNFGSLLLSIFVKDLLPKKLRQFQRCIVGLALSFFLLHRARRYVTYIDQRALLPSLNELKNATQNGLQQEKQQRERGREGKSNSRSPPR